MKKKIIIGVSLCAVLSMSVIPVSYVYATGSNWNNVIYPGVYIEDINVGGKEFTEVEELLQKKYSEPTLGKKIEVLVNNDTYILDYSNIEARYNITEVVGKALSYGKSGNMIQKYKLIKGEEKKEFKLSFQYNSKAIDEFLDKIEQQVNKNPKDAKIIISKGNIKITPETLGVKLTKDKLKEAILEVINGEPSNEGRRIKAPLEITKPQITEEKLSSINSNISSVSTSFLTSTSNRVNNIDLATKAIDGTLLMPGESFSFNETVGERTRARGYKEAGVIIGDKIESGLGGGICQVSSTLYNTLLMANIKIDERRNHTLPLTYIGKGLDATVDWGNIDLKFTNTSNAPIYIEGYIENKNVYFNIYSNDAQSKKTYEIVTDVSTVQPTIKYINDGTRLEGEKVVTKASSNGYKVKVYRKTYENGKLINTEVISNDYYTPVNGEIIRGTKKPF